MFRVYRVRPAEFSTARDGLPTFTASTSGEVPSRLAALGATRDECETVRRALEGVRADQSADVVLVVGGSLYRVHLVGPAPPRSPARPFTSERGARVLVATLEPTCWGLRDALRFLGYDASEHRPDASAPEGVEAAAASFDAHVALISGACLESLGEARLSAIQAVPRAIVAVGSVAADVRRRVDGALTPPLRVELLASVIDPLARRIRARRGARE